MSPSLDKAEASPSGEWEIRLAQELAAAPTTAEAGLIWNENLWRINRLRDEVREAVEAWAQDIIADK